MSWALPPRNAIFSGYTMGYDYFQKLVLALSPDLTAICREDGPQPFATYVCEYDTWRTRLPEEELEKAPILKIFDWKEDPDANTKFFFATRCVPAPDDSVTETSPPTAHETDVDRKRRDELIELIERRNNFLVDKSGLRFEAIKDVHPYYDSLGVRNFPSATTAMYWALPPRNAIFSGYTMGSDYFQKLVLALCPDLTTICREDGPQPFATYVCCYDTWRTRLPDEELEKAPILKVFNWKEDPDPNTKFFFATRCVPAPDDSITETSPSTVHETDVDRNRRDELIELINRLNNFSVDKSRLRFEAIKDVHPYYGV